ncbi:hypothetical protein Acor_45580 [Acrocarpospora corrugata]|uniref:Uncharacterized protein n=1 Tax=Acrocarpospora corrugata TaxID=35763 RepID=A0A5M3W391_9ACTN|nr:hypothetical protein [Acrocarpospora corrugata]GES02492.1 hypothetical protein Acor_45580 [Acrocarpospora corrugata]
MGLDYSGYVPYQGGDGWLATTEGGGVGDLQGGLINLEDVKLDALSRMKDSLITRAARRVQDEEAGTVDQLARFDSAI